MKHLIPPKEVDALQNLPTHLQQLSFIPHVVDLSQVCLVELHVDTAIEGWVSGIGEIVICDIGASLVS